MKAIVFQKKGKVALKDFPDPVPTADRILIKTLLSGISLGTETAWLLGKMPFDYPGIPGYLSLGEVLYVGEDTGRTDITKSQIVWAGGSHCSIINQVPVVVQPLPEDIDLQAACFCHLAAIGLHCLNRANSLFGEILYVAGQGLLGQITAQVGRALGMKVFASDIVAERASLSRKYSCDNAFQADDPALRKAIDKVGGIDVIVNSTGVPDLEDNLAELLKRHGRLVAQGMARRLSLDVVKHHHKEIAIILTADSTRDEDLTCLDWIAKGKLTIAPLIKAPLSPEQAVEEYVHPSSKDMFAALIDWSKIK